MPKKNKRAMSKDEKKKNTTVRKGKVNRKSQSHIGGED